jgi:hypothetical protein
MLDTSRDYNPLLAHEFELCIHICIYHSTI